MVNFLILLASYRSGVFLSKKNYSINYVYIITMMQ